MLTLVDFRMSSKLSTTSYSVASEGSVFLAFRVAGTGLSPLLGSFASAKSFSEVGGGGGGGGWCVGCTAVAGLSRDWFLSDAKRLAVADFLSPLPKQKQAQTTHSVSLKKVSPCHKTYKHNEFDQNQIQGY